MWSWLSARVIPQSTQLMLLMMCLCLLARVCLYTCQSTSSLSAWFLKLPHLCFSLEILRFSMWCFGFF